jgi:hypothetical protein
MQYFARMHAESEGVSHFRAEIQKSHGKFKFCEFSGRVTPIDPSRARPEFLRMVNVLHCTYTGSKFGTSQLLMLRKFLGCLHDDSSCLAQTHLLLQVECIYYVGCMRSYQSFETSCHVSGPQPRLSVCRQQTRRRPCPSGTLSVLARS